MRFDLIVIGAGAAGMNLALPAAKLGLKTLLVDKDPKKVGGECLHTGCVPSKALLHLAKLRHDARKLAPYGIETNGNLNFKKVNEYIKSVQNEIGEHESPEALQEFGVQLAFGSARFTSEDRVRVGEETYQARRIVLATGSRPRIPDIPGLDQVPFLTNENLFDLRELPARLIIIGGGPIGVEMAQAFTRLGSEVTLVERGERLLPRDPEVAADMLRARLEEEGAQVLLESEVTSFPSAHVAKIKTPAETLEKQFDHVLLAIGKKLDYSQLDLAKAGIRLTNGKLDLDKYLRTTNKRVYVSGDATGQIYLTHATELHGSVILWNLFSPLKKKISYDDLSWVTFTDPEVATFGLSEEELSKRAVSYRKVVRSFDEVNRATTDDYPESKLVLYVKSDRILGGTMVAPNAGELIQELILAKQNKIPIRKLLDKTYPYPTASRINRWVAIWEFDRKITDPIKKVLRKVYRILN